MNDNKQFVTKEEYEREIAQLREELEGLQQFKEILRMYLPFVLRGVEKSGHLQIKKSLEHVFEAHYHQNGKITHEGIQTFGSFLLLAAKDKKSYLDDGLAIDGRAWKKVAQLQAQTQEVLSQLDRQKKSDQASKDEQD